MLILHPRTYMLICLKCSTIHSPQDHSLCYCRQIQPTCSPVYWMINAHTEQLLCSSLQPQVPNCDLHHYIHECLAHLCGPGRLISAAEIALKGRILHSILPSRKWPHVRNCHHKCSQEREYQSTQQKGAIRGMFQYISS